MTDRPLALITGASKGIGRAVADSLAGTHDLLLGGRDEEALASLAAGLPSARPWAVELTDERALAAAVADIDRLDVLVHSAGISRLGPLTEVTAADWRESYELNVVAVVELTRLLLPALRAAEGHVVLINSGSGIKANPKWGPYAASKFALRAYADVLRAEEEPNGLRVTSVHPGRTATGMQKAVRDFEGGDYVPEKYMRPESVAAVVKAAVDTPRDAHVHEIVIRQPNR
ncbi:SDR family oxidoreductase [Actinophytocola algeriensis]|uniref:NADP-dependent 3-hydroxy acid dehydrogenase YdfG n=1 Tax=Actinophytocola algeriensis TaxID=1768010 RepID=A0A7W7Q4F4_9PSEU|nr:SDR family oxidoreductase [Actinophytocola algeriensis]MBB4906648.1 NADP-dependent 3-hydroxy acid dehydrogenase YdfG [Actinophytocola algeriensis]MBE1478129.1 NADP-dependent 3-hydroxy acid dehydrogenase YdfG [Actinophytocola algeriensis]